MKSKKNILRGVLIIIIAFVIFWTWYVNRYSMDVSPTYSVNTPEASTHLLVATQGSSYKNQVLDGVIKYYKQDDVFVRVIDVSDLSNVEPSKWDAVFVFHTWQYGSPPRPVRNFVEAQKVLSNVLPFATSGGGDEYIRGIDGISGASRMKEVDKKIDEVTGRIDAIFKLK